MSTLEKDEVMATKAKFWRVARLSMIVAALAAVALPAPAMADPDDLPYGPDTCIQGLVWREARTGDTVCVTPEFRSRTATENGNPDANKDPNGAYGPESCAQGFVWREAFNGDTICVTPAIRAENLAANAAAESNYQRNQPEEEPDVTDTDGPNVVFEITGTGTVYSIDIDPGGRVATENTAVPFKTTENVTDFSLLQVIAVTKTGSQGCRITLDGVVVVEQAPGTSAHCVYAP